MQTRHRFVLAVAVISALFFLVTGVWAFAAPANFFRRVAVFEPYNEHFLHDVGAFSIGLGLAALFAIWVRDAVVVALGAVGAAGVLHAIAHAIDRELGGRSSDPYTLGALALLMVAGAVVRWVDIRRSPVR